MRPVPKRVQELEEVEEVTRLNFPVYKALVPEGADIAEEVEAAGGIVRSEYSSVLDGKWVEFQDGQAAH